MGKYKSWSEKSSELIYFYMLLTQILNITLKKNLLLSRNLIQKLLRPIKSETDDLNDFQRSKIITDYIKLKNIKQKKLDQMLDEIKEVYLADGRFDQYEQSISFKVADKKDEIKIKLLQKVVNND